MASVIDASPKLVDYSSTDSKSSSEGPSPNCPSTKKRIHRMYSRGQKEKVAYCARHHGIREAARLYGLHHKNVQRWMRDQFVMLKNPRKHENKKDQGRKISYPPELEETLVSWILEKREQEFVAVSTQLIRLKALSLSLTLKPPMVGCESS